MVSAARTIQYGYAQTGWKDLMTSYNGQSITYDEIGNPLTYRDGMTMTWTGRQLTTLTQNGKQNTYKYDVDGLRLEKTAGGVTTQYQYVNGQLLGEKRSDGVILRYTYDALGVLSGIQYTNGGGTWHNYIVRCTLSGDVDQIFSTSGKLVARYIYDTWGNTLSVTDASGKAITDANHIANINPIRYRGYYYDAETGLYYLQSRYYDTTTRRFLNADSQLNGQLGVIGYNLFAYCENNPVNKYDPTGHFGIGTIIGAAIGGVIGGIGGAISAACSGKSIRAGFITGATTGAIVGGICGAVADAVSTGGLSVVAGAVITAAASGIVAAGGNTWNQYWNYKVEKKTQLKNSGSSSKSNTTNSRNTTSKSSNGKLASECNSFAEYIDIESVVVSGVTAAVFAPIGLGANCVVNAAFEGCVTTGLEGITAQVIANFAMGCNVSILQSIIDLL